MLKPLFWKMYLNKMFKKLCSKEAILLSFELSESVFFEN